MSIRNKLGEVAGKDDFELDSCISTGYIARLCWKYGWMMVRGKTRSCFHSSIANTIFTGAGVRLYCKKLMSIGSKTKIRDHVKIDALSTKGAKIRRNCVIGENTKIECTGSLSRIGTGIVIGDDTTFGNDCCIGAADGVEIGQDIVADQCIRFHFENHNNSDIV